MVNCAKCGVYSCFRGETEKLPPNCGMRNYADVYREAASTYKEKIPGSLALCAARVEGAGYGVWPRMREIMEFSRRAGFSKLGLAFCNGLRREAMEASKIFEENGFTVASVICKTGAVPKENLGIREEEKVRPGKLEVMCNPVAQALLLKRENTELNILLGLCVGHDSLFIMHSAAPVTVLAVKDRATGHNPLAAIYAPHYFRNRLDIE